MRSEPPLKVIRDLHPVCREVQHHRLDSMNLLSQRTGRGHAGRLMTPLGTTPQAVLPVDLGKLDPAPGHPDVVGGQALAVQSSIVPRERTVLSLSTRNRCELSWIETNGISVELSRIMYETRHLKS